MSQAVVDQLEPVDIQEHHRELRGRVGAIGGEFLFQTVHEQETVGQSGERIENLAGGNVAHGTSHPQNFAGAILHGRAAAANPPVGPIPVPHAVLAFECRAGTAGLFPPQHVPELLQVLGVHPREPLAGARPDLGVQVPEHGLPAFRVINFPGSHVPIPQAIVGASRCQRIPFLASTQSAFRSAARQLAMNTRQRDREIHRLGDVIVGAQVEGLHHLIAVLQGGHHDHRQLVRSIDRAHSLQHFHARHARHHAIEQHQIRALRADILKRRWAVRGQVHAKSMMFEPPRQHIAVEHFVVNQQQMIVFVHVRSPVEQDSRPIPSGVRANRSIIPTRRGRSSGLVA
jgi:hypothetical protein